MFGVWHTSWRRCNPLVAEVLFFICRPVTTACSSVRACSLAGRYDFTRLRLRRGIWSAAAILMMRGRGHFGDSDVADVTKLAVAGLVQQPAA